MWDGPLLLRHPSHSTAKKTCRVHLGLVESETNVNILLSNGTRKTLMRKLYELLSLSQFNTEDYIPITLCSYPPSAVNSQQNPIASVCLYPCLSNDFRCFKGCSSGPLYIESSCAVTSPFLLIFMSSSTAWHNCRVNYPPCLLGYFDMRTSPLLNTAFWLDVPFMLNPKDISPSKLLRLAAQQSSPMLHLE